MTRIDFTLDMITPGLCGGADPKTQAEIRPPSIRGQLRWWFRTLGGFSSMKGTTLREQENDIFGCVGKNNQRRGRLQVRTRLINDVQPEQADQKKLRRIGQNSPQGYLLFPLRTNTLAMYRWGDLPSFELHLGWRGDAEQLEDIRALATVFGCLGALGSRARRGLGALAFAEDSQPMPLDDALARFDTPDGITISEMKTPCDNAEDALERLADWLKDWRSHGGSPHLSNGPGFAYAKNDHDIGHGDKADGVTYRPALGLPIQQLFSSDRTQTDWNCDFGGRFASPVILRPARRPDGTYTALVVFVDAHKWPEGKKVVLSKNVTGEWPVSLKLYETMKEDGRLRPFTAG